MTGSRHPLSRISLLRLALSACALVAAPAFAAAPAAAPSPPARAATAPARALDNYTVLRLTVENERGEILLEKIADGWMTPAARSNQNRTVRESLAALAKDLGVSIATPRLAGLFSYQFRENPVDPNHAAVSFRAHYTARLDGPVGKPADAAKQYRWVARDRLDEFVTIQALNKELHQILDHPDTLWGGAFVLSFEGDKMVSTEQTEAFYPLRGP